ncbi:unnamed protein product [Heligmosomoides polygyrus]|uniref:DDE_Tnp_IS1595 domain-containing protein n=1 Tax=Heligmosomoides polygyrus TaxID=6339 RepID=A0A183F2F8_HELPZ|nr:unnamed protein product [Heligmosomoides polygyrus]
MEDCAANLKSLQSFSLSTSWDEFDRMSVEEFDAFLADRGLLWRTRKCPSCRFPCSLSCQRGDDGQAVRLRFECTRNQCRRAGVPRKFGYLKGTFFEQLTGSRKKLFLASALFVDDVGTLGDRTKQCDVNKNTMTQWNQWFRDVIVESFFESEPSRKIGGPNTILQLETTYIAERKCSRGRALRDCWIVGGIIDDSKEIFAEITTKGDPVTLDSILTKHILPGTTIGNLGYVHNTVDHHGGLDDSFSDVHSQGTENAWSLVKRTVKKFGLKGALEKDRFLESVWKWQHQNEPKLYLLWREIAKRYPLVD